MMDRPWVLVVQFVFPMLLVARVLVAVRLMGAVTTERDHPRTS